MLTRAQEFFFHEHGPERGVGDGGVGGEAECHGDVLDGLDVVCGGDCDWDRGARGEGAGDGEAGYDGCGGGGEEGEGCC